MASETLYALSEKANQSSRSFVARLADAILGLPKIKAESEDELLSKTADVLKPLLEAFIKAQSDAVIYGTAQVFDAFGLPCPIESGDGEKAHSTPLQTE